MESAARRDQLSAVADLAAGLRVERRLVENDDRGIAGFDGVD